MKFYMQTNIVRCKSLFFCNRVVVDLKKGTPYIGKQFPDYAIQRPPPFPEERMKYQNCTLNFKKFLDPLLYTENKKLVKVSHT